jgi:hypothetical protein
MEDWGQTESFLAFQQLDKFEGNIPSVPGFRPRFPNGAISSS